MKLLSRNLIIGFLILMLLAGAYSVFLESFKEVSALSKREINYTVLSEEEFEYLKNRRDAFLLSFLMSPNIFLAGDITKMSLSK